MDIYIHSNLVFLFFFQGFRMTVGNPGHDDPAAARSAVGLRYNCLQTLINRGPELADFPDKPCPAGIFAVHHFPASVPPFFFSFGHTK